MAWDLKLHQAVQEANKTSVRICVHYEAVRRAERGLGWPALREAAAADHTGTADLLRRHTGSE